MENINNNIIKIMQDNIQVIQVRRPIDMQTEGEMVALSHQKQTAFYFLSCLKKKEENSFL